MLKDIIKEYTDVYPEIIERAGYSLEKVKWQPWGWVHWGNLEQRKGILSPSWGGEHRDRIHCHHHANEHTVT